MPCLNHPAVTTGLVRCRRCGQTFCRNCVVALRAQYYCAQCKREQVRDIQSGTESGTLELATIGRRFGAQWVDGLLFMVIFVPLYVFFVAGAGSSTASNELGLGLTLIFTVVGAALVFVYEGLMLSSRGQTLGKMAVGIKVVTPEGNDITGGQAWGRALVRQVFFSYFALINYLPALFTKQRTAVHDLAVKTRVIRYRR